MVVCKTLWAGPNFHSGLISYYCYLLLTLSLLPQGFWAYSLFLWPRVLIIPACRSAQIPFSKWVYSENPILNCTPTCYLSCITSLLHFFFFTIAITISTYIYFFVFFHPLEWELKGVGILFTSVSLEQNNACHIVEASQNFFQWMTLVNPVYVPSIVISALKVLSTLILTSIIIHIANEGTKAMKR